MDLEIYSRAKEIGDYIINTEVTIRCAAKVFGISKSTVHKDVTLRLQEFDEEKYALVKQVLDRHKEERHMRGGEATRQKYLKIKQTDTD